MLLLIIVIYVQGRYFALFRESFNRLQNRLNSQERLELYVNYTKQLSPLPSSNTLVAVVKGTLVSGDVSSLDRESDGDFLVIEAFTPTLPQFSKEVELIRNGEFDEGFKYWVPSATQGIWRVVTIGSDYVAEHSVFVLHFPATATLRQTFTVAEEYDKVTLEFDFYMYVTRIGSYRIEVRINGARVFTRRGLTNTGWVHVGPIDVTEEVVKGTNIIEFRVGYFSLRRGYIFRLDSVSLKGFIVGPPPVGGIPIADIRFFISTPRNLMNSTLTLKLMVSEPCEVFLYAFDFNDEVWRLTEGAYSEGGSWFYLNTTLSEQVFLSRGIRLRLNVVSFQVSNFTLYIDYLGMLLYQFTPDNASLLILNNGPAPVYVVSAWLINDTYHYRFTVEQFIGVGMKLKVSLSDVTSLSPGCRYIIRVWTKVRAHEVEFNTP